MFIPILSTSTLPFLSKIRPLGVFIPFIILLDLVMPKADGFFVLEHIQKYNVDIPVIIISGDTSKESIEKAFDYGVVDMIKKPFDSDIIKDKIARYSK